MIGILYTTVANEADAIKLAEGAVASKIAGCVNIFPKIISVYQWQENVHRENECGLIFKTTEDKIPACIAWVCQHHPYEVPAIISLTAQSSEAFEKFLSSI